MRASVRVILLHSTHISIIIAKKFAHPVSAYNGSSNYVSTCLYKCAWTFRDIQHNSRVLDSSYKSLKNLSWQKNSLWHIYVWISKHDSVCCIDSTRLSYICCLYMYESYIWLQLQMPIRHDSKLFFQWDRCHMHQPFKSVLRNYAEVLSQNKVCNPNFCDFL